MKQQEEQTEKVEGEKQASEIERELEKIKREITKDKILTKEQEKQLADFYEGLKALIDKYGLDSVLEACDVSNLSLYKVNKGTVLIAINELADALLEINKNSEIRAFKYEHAQNGSVTPNSIQEAIAGKACIEQGLTGKLRRAEKKEEDFIEIETGDIWDVKTARTKSLNGKFIFDLEEFLASLKKAFKNPEEKIIIQVTNLEEHDFATLIEALPKQFSNSELERTIIIDAKNPVKSKKSQDLINMREKNVGRD